MKRFFKYILLSCCVLPAWAQPEAEYSEMEHTLGTLIWHNPSQATFTVKNTGNVPLEILDVEPDCGCTLVTWTHTPIEPGKSGSISARYDAEQLGHFYKSFAVYTNESAEPTYLSVSGKVVNQEQRDDVSYDYHFGTLDVSADEVEFDDVKKGEQPFRTLNVVNRGKEAVSPELLHLPPYIAASYAPEVLFPGRSGQILLTLDSRKVPQMGLTQTSVYLNTVKGASIRKENEIALSITLLPDLDEGEVARKYAPALHLDKKELNLGSFGSKTKKKDQIILTNNGRTPLHISALQVYNPGITVSLGNKVIKPGEKVKMKVTVTNNILRNKGRRRILLITDDPENAKTVIDINVTK